MNAWLERKREAGDLFTSRLLASPAGSHVAKVLLHGSVVEGTAQPESDVDVLVFQIGAPEAVPDICDEVSFQVVMETAESVEPLIYSWEDYRHPSSYFVYQAIRQGEELYSMEENELRQEEIRGLYALSMEYLEGAKELKERENYRLAVDAAYNAAELAVKGLILPKVEQPPKTHSEVVNRFGELYIKSEILPISIGKQLRRGLRYRNLARYDHSAIIGAEEARQTIQLASELLAALEANK